LPGNTPQNRENPAKPRRWQNRPTTNFAIFPSELCFRPSYGDIA
jgi:hypothetical protein